MEPHRTEMATALLSTYVSICSQPLSVSCAHNVLCPSIKKLQSDVRELVPPLEDSVAQVVAKLESVYGSAEVAGSVSSAPTAPEAGFATGSMMKLSQSPSLDDVKQKMGKLFTKPSPGNVQFWKKS